MDREDMAAVYGILGGEIYLLVRIYTTNGDTHLGESDVLKATALFGSGGLLGGILSSAFLDAGASSPAVSVAMGFVSSWFLITCAQLFGKPKQKKSTSDSREIRLRDVNEVADF